MKTEKKDLGFWQLFLVVFSSVGSGPAGIELLISTSGGIATACTALAIAPFVLGIPQALYTLELTRYHNEVNGGVSTWLLNVYGSRFWSFCAACFVVAYNCSMSALVAESSILYISTIADVSGSYWERTGMAVIIIMASYAINYYSIDNVVRFMRYFTIHTFAVFGILIVYGAVYTKTSRFTEGYTKPPSWSSLVNILVFSTSGYDAGGSVIAYAKNASDDLPRATFAAALCTCILCTMTYVFSYGGSSIPAADWKPGTFALIGRELGGEWLQVWIIIAAVLVNTQTFTGGLATAVYTVHGAAKNGVFPKFFKHETDIGTPDRALVVCCAASVVFAFLPFELNLAFEGVMFSLIILLEAACFYSISCDSYAYCYRSAAFTAAVVIPPTAVAMFALSDQGTFVCFGSLMLVAAIGFVAATMFVYPKRPLVAGDAESAGAPRARMTM